VKVLLLFLLLSFPSYAEVLHLSDEKFSDDPIENSIIRRMDYYTRMFIERSVPYVWGANWSSLALDCSGSTSSILRCSGVGHFPRTTAYFMWHTWAYKNKWTDNKEMWRTTKFPYLVYFTFPTKKTPRPFGHVAFSRGKQDATILFAEASSSSGYFKQSIMKHNSLHDKALVGQGELNLVPRR
jgi:hypothetical protein